VLTRQEQGTVLLMQGAETILRAITSAAVDSQRLLSDSKNSYQFMLAIKFNFVRIPNSCAELIYSGFVNFIQVKI